MYSVTTSEVKAIDLPTNPKRVVRHLLMYFDESYFQNWDIFEVDSLTVDTQVEKLVQLKDMIQNLIASYTPKGYSFIIVRNCAIAPMVAAAALRNEAVIIQTEMQGFTKMSEVADPKAKIDILATRIHNVTKLYGQKQTPCPTA